MPKNTKESCGKINFHTANDEITNLDFKFANMGNVQKQINCIKRKTIYKNSKYLL